MDRVVIRIRYMDFLSGTRDLAGLHGSAQRDARGVTVYLLPGLTGRQRKAVLRRLRQEASRGFGPALPLPGLLLALGLDRVQVAARTALAIVRLHPVLALLPGAAAGAMMLFVLAAAGGLGPAHRTGLDGVLASSSHPASAASAAPRGPALGPETGRGGSELGSGSRAPVWQARPHRRQHHARQHRARQHHARQHHARQDHARQDRARQAGS